MTKTTIIGDGILFVDDEKIAHKVAQKHLAQWNMISAYSAREALDILQNKDIKIVITDIGMPEMNGLEFLRVIKKSNPMTQVILATGTDDINDLVAAFEAGACDFLLKPVTAEMVHSSIANIEDKLMRWKLVMKKMYCKKKASC